MCVFKLFTIAYLPPLEYLIEMKNTPLAMIEQHENYHKQSARNRATILTANGAYDLIIPISKGKSNLIKDVIISNEVRWQQNHWKTIESAYNNSPFFLYYRDFFEPFFHHPYKFLFDYNIEILLILRKLFNIKNELNYTENYEKEYLNSIDLRGNFHPKLVNSNTLIPYPQVFENKFGFVPNLSCIDYLFTMGTTI